MLMQTGWPREALGLDYIVRLFQFSPSRESPSIIYSALYNKSDHTVLAAFPVSSTYWKHWETVTLWPHLDNTILDFRCPFQLCCTWKQSVIAWCSVKQLHCVLLEVVMHVFTSHVFHLIRQRLCFFVEPVLSVWRAKWLTTVWLLVV